MTERRNKPELLSPAGDFERLRMAVLYGADAVYLAGTSFGMRAFAGNFSPEELPKAVTFAHSHGVRVHATVNTMPRNSEADALPRTWSSSRTPGWTPLILGDLGAFTLAGRYAPRCERHVSTQASVTNYAAARAWHDLGAQAGHPGPGAEPGGDPGDPCQNTGGSGIGGLRPWGHVRQLLRPLRPVQLHDRRDASRGACAQPCRYQYYLMEEKRPGSTSRCSRMRRGRTSSIPGTCA